MISVKNHQHDEAIRPETALKNFFWRKKLFWKKLRIDKSDKKFCKIFKKFSKLKKNFKKFFLKLFFLIFPIWYLGKISVPCCIKAASVNQRELYNVNSLVTVNSPLLNSIRFSYGENQETRNIVKETWKNSRK